MSTVLVPTTIGNVKFHAAPHSVYVSCKGKTPFFVLRDGKFFVATYGAAMIVCRNPNTAYRKAVKQFWNV